jgi:hypothetical protein
MPINFANFFNQMASRVREAPQQQRPDYLKLMSTMSQLKNNRDYIAEIEARGKIQKDIARMLSGSRENMNLADVGERAYAAVKAAGGTDTEAALAQQVAMINAKGGETISPNIDGKALLESIKEQKKKKLGFYKKTKTIPQIKYGEEQIKQLAADKYKEGYSRAIAEGNSAGADAAGKAAQAAEEQRLRNMPTQRTDDAIGFIDAPKYTGEQAKNEAIKQAKDIFKAYTKRQAGNMSVPYDPTGEPNYDLVVKGMFSDE